MRIELYGFPGCPNTTPMRESLRAALTELGGVPFTEVNLESLPASDLRRGWPAPSVVIDGSDLFGMAPPTTATMSCRFFPEGLPDAACIAARLRLSRSC